MRNKPDTNIFQSGRWNGTSSIKFFNQCYLFKNSDLDVKYGTNVMKLGSTFSNEIPLIQVTLIEELNRGSAISSTTLKYVCVRFVSHLSYDNCIIFISILILTVLYFILCSSSYSRVQKTFLYLELLFLLYLTVFITYARGFYCRTTMSTFYWFQVNKQSLFLLLISP